MTDSDREAVRRGGELPISKLTAPNLIIDKCFEFVKNYIKETLEAMDEIPQYEAAAD